MQLRKGSRLGPYEILAPLGAGGMGEVYRGRDTRLGRVVAIKVLPSHLSGNSHLRERFDREARAISNLTHPHICTLYDVGHQDGTDYLVMEFIDGETLADQIARGPLPLKDVIRYGGEIADALHQAHRQGVVHRDLKPGNIMITKSGAKVLDFGLAKYTTRDPGPGTRDQASATLRKPLTEEGTILGTIQYMSPEQLEGHDADPRSDIFALGAILYEMTTGKHPFAGRSKASLIASIMQSDPPPLSSVEPLTPPSLEHLIRQCLAKDADDRFQSARDVRFALNEIQAQSPQPRVSKRSAFYAAGTFGVVLLVAIFWIWLGTTRRSTPQTMSGGRKVVAVLPLENLGADRSRDYLRLAIPDEIATILSYSRAIAVRPFTTTRRIAGTIDPQQAGKSFGAAQVITGHLLDEGGRLSVTLEAIDVGENNLLWRDVVNVASSDLLAMRRELAGTIRTGLLPRLEAASGSPSPAGPKSAEGYALYLRAAAASNDPLPNKEAVRMLEQAVRHDPAFAPAWAALSQRYYYDSSYSDGGEAAFARAQAAAIRARELDPDLMDAAIRLVIMRAEGGDTVGAYREARSLVERRPESSDAHFALSYVLRYPGLLQESARECNAAWSLDPANRSMRSCSVTFMMLGDYARGRDFLAVDAGSQWSRFQMIQSLLREGRREEAVRLAPEADANIPRGGLLRAIFSDAPQPEIDRAAAAMIAVVRARHDSEPFYFVAGTLATAGKIDQAREMLQEAVRRNYCGYPAMDTDPLLAPVRSHPSFQQLRQEGIACQQRFLRERND